MFLCPSPTCQFQGCRLQRRNIEEAAMDLCQKHHMDNTSLAMFSVTVDHQLPPTENGGEG